MSIDTYQGYMILFLLCVVCIICLLLLARLRKAKFVKSLERDWGKENTCFRDFSRISRYHTSLADIQKRSLDERTTADLNLDEVYAKIDRCESKIGQQYLYSILHSPTFDESVLKERGTLIDLFSNDPILRLKAQIAIHKLNKHLTYSIPNLIFDWELKRSKYRLTILFLSVIPVLSVILGLFYNSQFFFILPISFLVNVIVHYKNKERLTFFITPFVQIKALSSYAKKIASLDDSLNYPDLEKAFKKFKNLGLYQFLLASEKPDQNDFSSFVWLLFEYIKITFLLEINLLDKCMKIAAASRQEIHDLYKYIGEIDSSIAIASYRAGLDYYCVPKFGPQIMVRTINMIHPLIEKCVPNSLDTDGKNVLITGSNMSGKTTFIRTVAVNVILAQSIYTVCAESYTASFLNVSTSIGISDSILQGKSYYLEELESVYNFIERSNENGLANFFVMDELFKGTNTIERIAAGQAVLAYLSTDNNIIMVSTHDLELSKLLSNNYNLYYFSEEVSDQGFYFDHKIKRGILHTRNAIKLLEYFDYPSEIIQSANTYIQLTRN